MYFWLFRGNFPDFINLEQKGFTAKSIPESNSLVTVLLLSRAKGVKENEHELRNLVAWALKSVVESRRPDPLATCRFPGIK